MLFTFIFLTSSETIADLVPPFTLNSKDQVGLWEFNGKAIIHEDRIMLSPPVQFSKGSAWTNLEFPIVDWSVTFDLEIAEGTGGGGFGIWFVDKYGADGNLYGGPSQFRGIAITGAVKTVGESKMINFKILQDSGTLVFLEAPDADSTLYFNPYQTKISLRISFKSGFLYLENLNTDSQQWEVLSKRIVKIDIAKNYLGITAQSDQHTSRFDIRSISFSVDEVRESQNKVSMEHSTGNYHPKHTLRLRNPKFDKVLVEMGRMDANNENANKNMEASADRLLDVIMEMNSATFDTASFTEVNFFIHNTILPYVQKWHTRTIKVVNEIQNARNIYGAMWNYTHEMATNFKNNIKQSTEKTTEKIQNLSDLLLKDSEIDNDEQPKKQSVIVISLNSESFSPVIVILYASILEMVVFLSFLMIFQNPRIRERFFPSFFV
ncbi:Legume-like lectin family protein [Tritrichomonas foetus]|uniref:Legume-like lectin family protein n=1 Tax=Tritrichomonas foetus TaxID=1144522 RepID=A0A1J4L2P4_9EUKA|nr:Legume-like lectin family protein [Tritrichomonas foetus]|eukprot:OHT16244.1 Legume-like lectin family protein [Tritrichomonas foetus]